jgi:hypothetical protein
MADKAYFKRRLQRLYSQIENGIESEYPESTLNALYGDFGLFINKIKKEFPDSFDEVVVKHYRSGIHEEENARADLIWMKSQLEKVASALSIDLNSPQESQSSQSLQNVNLNTVNQSTEVSLKQHLELYNNLSQVQKLIQEEVDDKRDREKLEEILDQLEELDDSEDSKSRIRGLLSKAGNISTEVAIAFAVRVMLKHGLGWATEAPA